MEENPLVDFTPAFEDYRRHMADLRDKFGYPTRLVGLAQDMSYCLKHSLTPDLSLLAYVHG